MSRIPESTIERIRAAVDIVDVIGERVDLTRRGRNWIGLCPFHVEKTPSFNVNPEWSTFKCFGCGRAGNIYGFLMEYDQLTFREAVSELGRQVGIPVEDDEDVDARDMLAPQRAAVEWAHQRFASALWSPEGERARRYLQSRGFDEATLRAFGVGFAPESWSWLIDAARADRAGPDLETMVIVGLAKARDGGGGAYDFYRDRVIFPIMDRRGRPIAFGGRIMPDNPQANEGRTPKYVNSPDSSPLYNKRRVLYGYHQGRDAIRRSGRVIVAEGYTDVIMAHQSGVGDVVACCGTALTDEHAQFLARIASKRVVLLFDGDSAGQKAAEKSLDCLLPLGREVSVVALPDGADPHEYLLAYGPDAFNASLEQGRDAWSFKLAALAARHDMQSPAGKSQAIDELIESLGKLANPVERELQATALARQLGVDPRTFAARRSQREGRRPPSGVRDQPPTRPLGPAGLPPEAFLLEVLAHRSDLAQTVITQYPLGRYRDDAVRRIAAVLYARLGERDAGHPGVGALIALLEDPAAARLLHAAVERTGRPEELDRPLADFFGKIDRRDKRRQAEALKAELHVAEQARDTERINAILEQYRALMGAS